jgi:hypothetical protein
LRAERSAEPPRSGERRKGRGRSPNPEKTGPVGPPPLRRTALRFVLSAALRCAPCSALVAHAPHSYLRLSHLGAQAGFRRGRTGRLTRLGLRHDVTLHPKRNGSPDQIDRKCPQRV